VPDDAYDPVVPAGPRANPPAPGRGPLVVVMGVAGSGKSTVGPLVATALDVPFLDGDDFHDAGSIERMRTGMPLDEAARAPWLDRLHTALDAHRDRGAVLACSALTPASRSRLTAGLDVVFAWLRVPGDVLAARLGRRRDHFAGAALLDSQLDTLEVGPDVVPVDGDRPAATVAADVVDAVRRASR
jgi:gluconokinase